MAECALTTDEFPCYSPLNHAITDSNFRPLHRGADWGFDPKIFEYTLTHLDQSSLDGVLAELREYHHFDYVKSDSEMIQGFVSKTFSGLGARHAFAYIVQGVPRGIIYGYYTNNPDLHLSWHYLFDPRVQCFSYDEMLRVTELIREQLYVYSGEPHVKKRT